jgi:hypothetical protein
VTLIMTHVSQRRIFQSGDFRLTDARTGRDIDYWAQKQIIVQRFEWTALVGFCGIAHTGLEYVPEWIVEQLRATPVAAPFEDLLSRLQSAEEWLKRTIPRFRALTFSVGAFVEFKPHFLLISNFEAIGRPPRARSTFPATLEVTRFRPKKEQLFLSGRPESVPMGERQRLLGIFRKVPPPEEGYAALAAVNRRASERDRAVGPRALHRMRRSWAKREERCTAGRRTATTYRRSSTSTAWSCPASSGSLMTRVGRNRFS